MSGPSIVQKRVNVKAWVVGPTLVFASGQKLFTRHELNWYFLFFLVCANPTALYILGREYADLWIHLSQSKHETLRTELNNAFIFRAARHCQERIVPTDKLTRALGAESDHERHAQQGDRRPDSSLVSPGALEGKFHVLSKTVNCLQLVTTIFSISAFWHFINTNII